MKVKPGEDGKLLLRGHITGDPGELESSALLRGTDNLLRACPDTHQPQNVQFKYERDRWGRSDSRRVFLTLVAELRR